MPNLKKKDKLKIIITKVDIAKKIADKMPSYSVDDIKFFIESIVNVMQKRIIAGIPTTIDNFGTIVRVKCKPKVSFNVVTREPFVHNPMRVKLLPNYSFLWWVRQPKNRKEILNKITIKSEEYRRQNGGDKCLKVI